MLHLGLEALEYPDQSFIPSEHIEHGCRSIISSDEQWSELEPQSGATSVCHVDAAISTGRRVDFLDTFSLIKCWAV